MKFINKIIRTLIVSDFFLNSGFGLIAPIFAIFIIKNISTGSVSQAAEIAGFSALIFWIAKSILQIPIGRYLDKNHGEIDDFWFTVASTCMMAFVPLGYLFASEAWHIYLLQLFYALAAAMNFTSWSAIFTRHIDSGKEAVEWGTHSTVSGFGVGIAGGIGGVAAGYFGFSAVFLLVSLFSFICAGLLLLIRHDISPINKNSIRGVFKRPIV